MTVLLVILYIIVGALITFLLFYLHGKSNKYYDDGFYCVVIGIFWPIAAPFALALYFANEMNRRK